MGIISSAIGAVGSIVGGITASKAAKSAYESQVANIEEQQDKNQDWYDRRYNEDSTQRADAQAILTQTQDTLRSSNRSAAGSAAVNGGTEESVAAAKAAANKTLADATSQIAVAGEQRKDSIESTYLQNDNALANQLNQAEADYANGKVSAITGATQGITTLAGGLDF
ncbi:MAG: hypothetical protein SNG14_03205 [Rikenellaceae bacterium]